MKVKLAVIVLLAMFLMGIVSASEDVKYSDEAKNIT